MTPILNIDYPNIVNTIGSIFVNAKTYNSFDEAQNDETLKVGESFKCNGFHMYKQ